MRVFLALAFLTFHSIPSHAKSWSFYEAQCKTTNTFSWTQITTWSDCPMQPCELTLKWNDDTKLYDTYITPECKTPLTDYILPPQCSAKTAHTWFYFFTTIKDCWSCEITKSVDDQEKSEGESSRFGSK